MLTKEQVLKAISKTRHPEIDYSLVDLGMVKDVEIEKDSIVTVRN